MFFNCDGDSGANARGSISISRAVELQSCRCSRAIEQCLALALRYHKALQGFPLLAHARCRDDGFVANPLVMQSVSRLHIRLCGLIQLHTLFIGIYVGQSWPDTETEELPSCMGKITEGLLIKRKKANVEAAAQVFGVRNLWELASIRPTVSG